MHKAHEVSRNRRRHLVAWGLLGAIALLMALGIYQSRGMPAQAVPEDSGRRDFQWNAPYITAPTAEKSQSKLWYNDGIWWGILYDTESQQFHIWRFDAATRTWSDTSTFVDNRNNSHADVLWDGTRLYVATAVPGVLVPPPVGDEIRLLRYSYDATTKTYTLDEGFPAIIAHGAVEQVVLDKDSTGQLWATYTLSNTVYVNTSQADQSVWGTPFVPSVSGTTVASDDISTLVAFNGNIGLMWSNQVDKAFYFAVHQDTDADDVWQPSIQVVSGPDAADDHINLKADSAGKLYAAVKTNKTRAKPVDPNAPLIQLLARDVNGTWSTSTVSTVADDQTRPQVVLDEGNRALYVYATTQVGGGNIDSGTAETAIYYKQSSLDAISFAPGKGAPLIETASDRHVNDATSTKQTINSATGLLVEAEDQGTIYYLHNYLPVGACPIEFQDVPPSSDVSSFYPYVRCLACRGVLGGYPCGAPDEPCGTSGDPYFRPNNLITRGQIAKVVSNAAGFGEAVSGQTFADVPPSTDPSSFYVYIERLTARGVMSGYPCGQAAGETCDGENRPYFRPGANATRAQLAKIVSNAAGFNNDVQGETFADVPRPAQINDPSSFYLFVERLAQRGVMGGYPCGQTPDEPCDGENRPYFRPSISITRAQAAKIVSNTLYPDCQAPAADLPGKE